MGKVILTAEQRAMMNGSGGKTEVFDERGNLLGYFTPAAAPAAGAWGPFTAEEVEAAFNQTGPARTLDEIFREHGGI